MLQNTTFTDTHTHTHTHTHRLGLSSQLDFNINAADFTLFVEIDDFISATTISTLGGIREDVLLKLETLVIGYLLIEFIALGLELQITLSVN